MTLFEAPYQPASSSIRNAYVKTGLILSYTCLRTTKHPSRMAQKSVEKPGWLHLHSAKLQGRDNIIEWVVWPRDFHVKKPKCQLPIATPIYLAKFSDQLRASCFEEKVTLNCRCLWPHCFSLYWMIGVIYLQWATHNSLEQYKRNKEQKNF